MIPARPSVCAVVVTFNPRPSLLDNIEIIARQVSLVIMVDNASGDAANHIVEEIDRRTDVELIRNDRNYGVAKALNIGIGVARKRRFDYVVFFDQDSEPTDNQIDILLDIYSRESAKGKVGVIGSAFADVVEGGKESVQDTFGVTEETMVITSGSLSKVETIVDMGMFCEPLFIDHVDTEFCLKMRKHGFRVLKTKIPLMKHAIGDKRHHKIMSREISTTHHNAERRYYQARNLVILHRLYYGREKRFILHMWASFCKSLVYVLLYEEDKLGKSVAALRGLVEGSRMNLSFA